MSSYLLDTHTVLWLASNPDKLPAKVQNLLLAPSSKLFVSIASAWEVAIKLNLGKLDLEGGISTFFDICSANSVQILNINKNALEALPDLPFIHRDPFDRLLVVTALTENLTMLSADKNIQQYKINCIW